MVGLSAITLHAEAAVVLLYFRASSGNQVVRLEWATATELDTAGFFVQRSSQRDSGYIRINADIIPAVGDAFSGDTYEYTDTGLANGIQYWYRLESIDLGQNSQYSDPVFVIVGIAATQTLAQTNTATPTATLLLTLTSNFQTNTATATQIVLANATATSPAAPIIVTATPNLAIASLTPGSGSDPYPALETPQPAVQDPVIMTAQAEQNNQTGGPTPTYLPLPTVTIIFPTSAATPIPVPDLDVPTFTFQRLFDFWPIGVILLAWIALAVWFVVTRRHLD